MHDQKMRVAVTGGIAEGKSNVLQVLAAMGRTVASSDEIARSVLSDLETQRLIADALGYPSPPTRDELRSRIAQDVAARRALNRITHPRIVEALRAHPAQFVEVPLLLEACLYGMFSSVWVVTCGREEQVARLRKRYGDDGRAERLLSTQMPSEAKLAFADEIIRTNGPIENVPQVVAGLVAGLPESGL